MTNQPYEDDEEILSDLEDDDEEEEVNVEVEIEPCQKVELTPVTNDVIIPFASTLNIVYDNKKKKKDVSEKKKVDKLYTFSKKKTFGENINPIKYSMTPGPNNSLSLPKEYPPNKLKFPTWISMYNDIETFDHETDLVIVTDKKKLENFILFNSKNTSEKRAIMFIDPYLGFVNIYYNLLWSETFPYLTLISFFLSLFHCKRIIMYQCCMNIRYSISRICMETKNYHKMFNYVIQNGKFIPSKDLLEEDLMIVSDYKGFTNITSEYLKQSTLYKVDKNDKKKMAPIDKLNREVINLISFDHRPPIESIDLLTKTLFSEIRGKKTFRILDILSPLKRVFPLIPLGTIIARLEFVITNFSNESGFPLFNYSGIKGSWDEDIEVSDKLEYYYSQTIIIPLDMYTLHLSWLDLNVFMRKNPYMFNLEYYKKTIADNITTPEIEKLLYNVDNGTLALNKKNQMIWKKKPDCKVFSRYPAYNMFEWVALLKNKTFIKKCLSEEAVCTTSSSIKEYRQMPGPVYGKNWNNDVKNVLTFIKEFRILLLRIPSIVDNEEYNVDQDPIPSVLLRALLSCIKDAGSNIFNDGVYKNLGDDTINKIKSENDPNNIFNIININ